jgi:hypothetical protein
MRATRVSAFGSVGDQSPPQLAGDVCGDNCRPDLLAPYPIGQAPVPAADGDDGADANANADCEGLTVDAGSIGEALRPGRHMTAPTSEGLAEVLEAVGLPALARRLSEEALSLGPRLD